MTNESSDLINTMMHTQFAISIQQDLDRTVAEMIRKHCIDIKVETMVRLCADLNDPRNPSEDELIVLKLTNDVPPEFLEILRDDDVMDRVIAIIDGT